MVAKEKMVMVLLSLSWALNTNSQRMLGDQSSVMCGDFPLIKYSEK